MLPFVQFSMATLFDNSFYLPSPSAALIISRKNHAFCAPVLPRPHAGHRSGRQEQMRQSDRPKKFPPLGDGSGSIEGGVAITGSNLFLFEKGE